MVSCNYLFNGTEAQALAAGYDALQTGITGQNVLFSFGVYNETKRGAVNAVATPIKKTGRVMFRIDAAGGSYQKYGIDKSFFGFRIRDGSGDLFSIGIKMIEGVGVDGYPDFSWAIHGTMLSPHDSTEIHTLLGNDFNSKLYVVIDFDTGSVSTSLTGEEGSFITSLSGLSLSGDVTMEVIGWEYYPNSGSIDMTLKTSWDDIDVDYILFNDVTDVCGNVFPQSIPQQFGRNVWLMEIDTLDSEDTPVTLRFSSAYYTDEAGNFYDERIQQPALFTSSAFTGNILQSGSRSAFGEAVLVNVDGGLDYLVDYAMDGRTAITYFIDEWGVKTEILRGVVKSLTYQEKTISVALNDPQEVLDLPHPSNKYAGDNVMPNGFEGTKDDIKGNSKPRVFGKVSNMSPICVNTSKLIYQVNDGAFSDATVVSIYDNGVELTRGTTYTNRDDLAANIPADGTYDRCKNYFRLRGMPVGELTCDVDGNVHLLGDVLAVVADDAGWDVDGDTIIYLNNFGEAGVLLESDESTSSLIDKIATSVGGYWYFKDATTLAVNQISQPDDSGDVVEIFDYNIINITRNSAGAGSNGIPVYKVSVMYDKIETVINNLQTAAPPERISRFSNEYRKVEAKDDNVKLRHLLSTELELPSVLKDHDYAEGVATTLQSVIGVRRDTVSATVRVEKDIADAINIGSTVRLHSYKYGYSSGRLFTVLGFTLDARLMRVSLELFG